MGVTPKEALEAVTPAGKEAAGGQGEEKEMGREKTQGTATVSDRSDAESTKAADSTDIYVPADDDDFIDPRLKDYPIPLVAKTVSLHNDFTEPILTFRFWFLSTFWISVGCGVSSVYYFKPYASSLTSFAVQLLSWGMGSYMGKALPTRKFRVLGWSFSLNPGGWNAKEHALVLCAYWGSCYTAYGLGPLTALELYYGRRVKAGWAIIFLLTSQMIGYGFSGIYRDILVRPPKLYYPGTLPNVALFNAMHHNPSVTQKSLRFFAYVACATFVWQWMPGFIFPMLSSLPLLCWMTHGNWKGFLMGSGNYGFGLLTLSLDWNYIDFWGPMFTPLWAAASSIGGAVFSTWLLYPIMYFSNTLNAQKVPPMSSGTYDNKGHKYNITRVMTDHYTLNQTAMDEYSRPYWSTSYTMTFFWSFACATGALTYAILWYGKESYLSIVGAWKGRREDYNDPYLKLMSRAPRVPHWWYLSLLAVCVALSLACLYGAETGLPWWGFLLITFVSVVFTFPNGILFGVASIQVGMGIISELLAGGLFTGNPTAMLTCLTYGRQILEQNLNLISDYKFGFYMKVPEKEMFIGQVYGTLLGPFVNYAVMRVVIDNIGADTLTGGSGKTAETNTWLALHTRNYYSTSVLWGVIGPKVFFSRDSPYHWAYWAFLVGPALVAIVYAVHRWKPHWKLEQRCNPVVIMAGASSFPGTQTTNLMTSALASFFFMGYVFRYHPAWFRKYNYLLGIGLSCGTQICQTVIMLAINLPNATMPFWWGNHESGNFDRCFPPEDLPSAALN